MSADVHESMSQHEFTVATWNVAGRINPDLS